MEQARLIIAIALSILVFIIWGYFQEPATPPNNTQHTENITQKENIQLSEEISPSKSGETKETSLQTATEQSVVNLEEQETASAPMDPVKKRSFLVETPFYEVQISETEGQITSFRLKKFRQSIKKDAPFLDLIDQQDQDYSLTTELTNTNIPNSGQLIFQSNVQKEQFEVKEEPLKLEMTAVIDKGLSIKKTFVFYGDRYGIDYDLSVINQSGNSYKADLGTVLKKTIKAQSGAYGFEGPSFYMENKLQQIKPKKIQKTPDASGAISWNAVQDRYFIKALMPREERSATLKLNFIEGQEKNENSLVENRTIEKDILIGSHSNVSKGYEIYFGPLQGKILKKQGHQLQKAINFGWFDFIAKPCLWFMNFFYEKIISNYGIAIIVLTIIAKIILWPLGNKSYKSMNQMKKLQPMMAEIREKYKNDKKRMNEELMGLYKLYKINPMGGCLPMVLQIPVFFALYRMLYSAIELRHAPFFGWIQDLSAPDRLFNFEPGFNVPLMQEPYGIPVLTVIMGATMILQQKMTPQAGDPTQAKMMMLMPVIFTFIFINFPSGLVLYWLVNNLLSIGQQQFVSKKHS